MVEGVHTEMGQLGGLKVGTTCNPEREGREKGQRVTLWLQKAMNGLRRAPLLWLLELQRTVYSLGRDETFVDFVSCFQEQWGIPFGVSVHGTMF